MMEQLVNFIIRPPRADYCPKNDLLEERFILKGRWFHRKDLKVKNGRGLLLHCSHYVPGHFPDGNTLPCVIYCHGNSGCRADASEAAIILLPSNITVFTLDFSGSGCSEGEHVTLGWNEKEDLRAVVNYLRTEGNVSCIGLWGRSMGAVTSLLYGVEDPSIAGMVLDSPFSNLVDLMMELVDTYKYPLPKFTVKLAIQHMHRVIKKKANFDITDLDTIKAAKNSFVPALFGHATDDDFIQPHHSDQIYKSYTGDKNIIKFDGDHNSPRPQFYFDSITIFFHNVLNPPAVVYDEHFQPDMHDYFDVDNWQAMNMLNCEHNSITAQSSEPITRSKEDAINQVRQRRPMSRTDVPPDVSNQEKLVGLEDDQINTYTQASSSDMINYERYNGSSEYLQYSTDIISDMPSCIEDEERMLMEAIIMSLNNSVATQASEKNDPSSANYCETSSHTFSKLTLDKSSKSSASFTSSENALIVTHKDNLSRGNAQVSLDIVGSTQGETKADTGDEGTSARLVVQKKIKKSSGHILDGLAHKWGNFLRNNEEKH